MVVFPALSALISLAFALLIARDALRRPRPDKVAWAIAFAIFALAAGAEVAGAVFGWTSLLARLYYLTGAVLVVWYLALGELYLLAPRRIGTVAPGVTLLVTAIAATVVWAAPIERDRLAADGWEAIERGPGLIALAASINALGTVVIVGGALYSAWRFSRLGTHRHRMIGCLLIAGGTFVVAAGGTLTRFGHQEYLYIAMAAGVAIIFAGYLETRRPERREPAVGASVAPSLEAALPHEGGAAPVPLAAARAAGRRPTPDGADPGVAFLEARFLPLDDAALREICRVWSAEPRDADRFTRDEARRVWALRLRLSPAGQEAFDAHSVPAQLQLAELYHEVFAPGMTETADARVHGG